MYSRKRLELRHVLDPAHRCCVLPQLTSIFIHLMIPDVFKEMCIPILKGLKHLNTVLWTQNLEVDKIKDQNSYSIQLNTDQNTWNGNYEFKLIKLWNKCKTF